MKCGGLRRRWRRAGEFGITQPVFDLRLLDEFLDRIEGFRIPIVAGIWPLTSVKNAEFMRDQLKVSMPEEILARMGRAATPEAARAEGIAIAQEMLAEVRARVQGVQVSAPFGKYKAAAQVLGFASRIAIRKESLWLRLRIGWWRWKRWWNGWSGGN